MKRSMLVLFGAAAALSVASSAAASGGCGPAFHRGAYGRCFPNGGPAVFAGGPALGVFYPGRGYWDGRRYWGNRYRWHGGWRYH